MNMRKIRIRFNCFKRIGIRSVTSWRPRPKRRSLLIARRSFLIYKKCVRSKRKRSSKNKSTLLRPCNFLSSSANKSYPSTKRSPMRWKRPCYRMRASHTPTRTLSTASNGASKFTHEATASPRTRTSASSSKCPRLTPMKTSTSTKSSSSTITAPKTQLSESTRPSLISASAGGTISLCLWSSWRMGLQMLRARWILLSVWEIPRTRVWSEIRKIISKC